MNSLRKHLTPLAISLAATAAVHADVAVAQFQGTGDFSYAVNDMTDLDQKRDLLPNDGKAYCVPTAAMDLVTYAANFGFPQLFPGPGLWEGAWGYDAMTSDLALMGALMNTDATSGTDLSGQYQGLTTWLQGSGMGSMSVVSIARDEDYWPTIDVAAFMAVGGAVVDFIYGRYDFTYGFQGVPCLTQRKQGHCVTLQRTLADNGDFAGPRTIQFCNPGSPDDGDLTLNSTFAPQDVPTATNLDVGIDADGDGDFEYFNVTSLVNPPPDDNRYRVLDAVLGLYPPGGLSYTEVEVNAQFANGGLGFSNHQQPAPYGTAVGSRFVSVVPHPELHSALAIVAEPNGRRSLYQLPHAGGRPTRLLDLPANTRHLVLGHGHDVFAVGDAAIQRLKVRTLAAATAGVIALPTALIQGPVEAATYVSETDELVVLSATGGRVVVFDGRTFAPKGTYTLAAASRVSPARSVVAWGRKPTRLLLATGNGRILEGTYSTGTVAGTPPVTPLSLTPRSLPNISDPISIDRDGSGRLYVSDSRKGLLEFDPLGATAWQPASRPLYARYSLVGKKFAPLKNHHNLTPGRHDLPEWRNAIDVLP